MKGEERFALASEETLSCEAVVAEVGVGVRCAEVSHIMFLLSREDGAGRGCKVTAL